MTYDENYDFETLNDKPPKVRSTTAVMDEPQVLEPEQSGTLATINKSELTAQQDFALAHPRSIKGFRNRALQMATLTEEIASECIYALPRGGKTIEGPSARFAEILHHAWGNCRAGARKIGEDSEFVTAQGVFHDVESNSIITYEVSRRITTSKGKRYDSDMIGVTSNAASSIALRNAVLKGIPKALWVDIYEAARRTAVGDQQTLANRRAAALGFLQKQGATEEMVLGLLGVEGVEDITLDHLIVLKGLATAIKEGDTTVEQAFAQNREEDTRLASGGKTRLDEIKARHAGPQQPSSHPSNGSAASPSGTDQEAVSTAKSTSTFDEGKELALAREKQAEINERLKKEPKETQGVSGLFDKK